MISYIGLVSRQKIITRDGKSEMMPPGRYDCRLERVDGEWLFKHCLVVLDAEFKLEGI